MNISHIWKRTLPLWLSVVLVFSLLTGCAASFPTDAAPTTSTTAATQTTAQTTTTVAPADTARPTAAPTTAVKPNPIREMKISKAMSKRLDAILKETGTNPLNIFRYVNENFRYKWVEEKTMEQNAAHILDYGTGACYNFAALTFLLFQQAGYPVCYVTGTGRAEAGSSYHCWIATKIGENWWYVDSLYKDGMNLTARRLKYYGYRWDQTVYPY